MAERKQMSCSLSIIFFVTLQKRDNDVRLLLPALDLSAAAPALRRIIDDMRSIPVSVPKGPIQIPTGSDPSESTRTNVIIRLPRIQLAFGVLTRQRDPGSRSPRASISCNQFCNPTSTVYRGEVGPDCRGINRYLVDGDRK